jgi:hypothetical protein
MMTARLLFRMLKDDIGNVKALADRNAAGGTQLCQRGVGSILAHAFPGSALLSSPLAYHHVAPRTCR